MADNKNEQFSVEWLPRKGTLQSDVAPDNISGGNLYVTGVDTGAYNVRNTGKNLATDYEFVIGNRFACAPDPIHLQNKTFRLYLTYIVGVTYIFEIFDPNGNLVSPTFHMNTGGNLNAMYQGLIQALVLSNNTYTATSLTTTSTTTGYFDVSIDQVAGWDYTLSFTLFAPSVVVTQVTILEPIDASLVADWNLIGSWDLQGELILWWTTQRNLPTDIAIVQVTNNGSNLWRVETTTPYNLVTGEKVILKNVGIADGSWIVTVVSATEFDVQGTPFPFVLPAFSSISVVTTNPNGIGELGRAVKNEQTGVWSYIRLIRAKALNWVTKHQQDTLCKKDALRKTYRYTDDYNVPGTLYDRTINYVNDCLLTFVDPRNTYSYENIGSESQMMIQGGDYDFAWTSQDQSGGSILSGNTQYAIELITDADVATEFSSLSNHVQATTSSETGSATSWSGDNANVNTTKINNFLVTGDLLDNFKWVRLSFVNYQDDAFVGFSLPKVLITSNSMVLRHTGNEFYTDLDVGLFNKINAVYRTALSIDELDGRVILSNLTSWSTFDASALFASVTHSVKREVLTGVGSRYNGNLTINEFQKTVNTYSVSGYMINEIYRYAFRGKLPSGGWSQYYWGDDIRIDNFPTNTAPTTNDPNRRIAGLPDLNLTNSSATEVYVPYIEFNIDWDGLVNGVRLRDIFTEIEVGRVEMTDALNEVKAMGVVAMAMDFDYATNSANSGLPSGFLFEAQKFTPCDNGSTSAGDNIYQFYPNAVATQQVCDWIFLEGADSNLPSFSYATGSGMHAKRDWMSFYSDDLLSNKTTIGDFGSDIGKDLIVWGQPSLVSNVTFNNTHAVPDTSILDCNLREFTGYTNAAINPLVTRDIVGLKNIGQGQTSTIGGQTEPYSKGFSYTWYHVYPSPPPAFAPHYNCQIDNPSSPSLVTSALVPFQGIGTDKGCYIAQIYQAITDKFGDKTLSKYISTGAFVKPTSSTVSVFGGDTFTQKSWLKHRLPSAFNIITARANACNPPHDFHYAGMGGGISYYSQNRVNSQMINRNDSSVNLKYPNEDEIVWLLETNDGTFTLVYNHGYDLKNSITSYSAFDPDQSLVATDFPVRLIYSQKTNPEQASDLQRIFLPFDFTDLEYKDGEIVHHRVVNSELCSWQENRFDRLYFHSNTLLSTNSGSEVITGEGGAFTNRPNQLSSYGCPNKWLIGIGRSAGGKQVAYWLNPILKCFIRHGGDGTTNQGVIHGMDAFFRENTTLLIGKDKPADGMGGCCVWDEQYKEVLFAIRSWKDEVEDWDAGSNYNIGDEVVYGTNGFEEIPQFYRSVTNNVGKVPSPSSGFWQQIQITNPLYYNFYTIVYSEIKNGFAYFTTPHPNIFAPFRNGFLSPNPISNTGRLFEHNKGVKGVWYGTQEADAFLDAVINDPKNVNKTHIGIFYASQIAPFRVEFTTQENVSYLDKADFKKEASTLYTSTIKNDSTVTNTNPTGLNSLRTSRIFGTYIIVRTKISRSDAYQNIMGFFIKLFAQARMYNK